MKHPSPCPEHNAVFVCFAISTYDPQVQALLQSPALIHLKIRIILFFISVVVPCFKLREEVV